MLGSSRKKPEEEKRPRKRLCKLAKIYRFIGYKRTGFRVFSDNPTHYIKALHHKKKPKEHIQITVRFYIFAAIFQSYTDQNAAGFGALGED